MHRTAALLSGITWASLMGGLMAQESAKPASAPIASTQVEQAAKSKDSAKAVVEKYFENWKGGKGEENVALFHSPQVVVSGMFHSPKVQYWSKTAAEYRKQFPDKPIEHLPVDSIDVEMLHEGLISARAKYRGGGHKDAAVFTLSRNAEGQWKIVSLYVDSHFVW